jgi:hypothetical protein
VRDTLERVSRQFGTFGAKLQEESFKMQDQSSFINPETDIKMFINEHKSENDLPVPGSLDMQVQAADYAKYKEMLAEITRRELKRMNDEEEEKRVAQESLNPPEYVKKLVYKLVIENRALSLKEMDYVKLHIEKPNIPFWGLPDGLHIASQHQG